MCPYRWRPKARGKRVWKGRWKWYIWFRKMYMLYSIRQYMKQVLKREKIKMVKRW